MCSALFKFGFKQSVNDYFLFSRNVGNSVTSFPVYVDDIILTGSHETKLNQVKEFLKTRFLIKDLGVLKYFKGIEVVNTVDGLCLNQRKYFFGTFA